MFSTGSKRHSRKIGSRQAQSDETAGGLRAAKRRVSSQGKSIICIGAIVGVASVVTNLAMAQSQTLPPSVIADNDSVYIDGKTFSITPGRAKGDTSTQIEALGARDLGP